MRRLFLKVFAIFWLAQSLIFIISTTMIVRQRFQGPSNFSDALDTILLHDGEMGLRAYQAGGCTGFVNNSPHNGPAGAALLDESGKLVCATPNAPSTANLVSRFPDRLDERQVSGRFVWLTPLTSSDGKHFEYAWFQAPTANTRPPRRLSLLHFAFPQLPVAIAVGGVTTLVLVLLFSSPLTRLRKAARELAAGNLSARVAESRPGSLRPNSDEFHGLIHDFNHMAERLESLVAAQRLLLRDVSHELRSPLARLSVALELAREDAEPEQERHLDRIERETERLNQLIGQLLTLSSMEAMENVSTFTSLSLNSLCEQILRDAEYEAQQRSCSVILDQECEGTVFGDWELLYRAVENVVRNAIRYTAPETQVTVQIRETVLGSKRFASIAVEDHGPGVPEGELMQIFRPFYRLDQARSAATGGFGVGLAITERAVRLHGGTLRAANNEGGGICIEMMLPTQRS